MRLPLRDFRNKAADAFRGTERNKASFKESLFKFLGPDAIAAKNLGNQVELARNYLKACPAISEAISPILSGLTNNVITPFIPKDKPAPGLDIHTLAELFDPSIRGGGLGTGRPFGGR